VPIEEAYALETFEEEVIMQILTVEIISNGIEGVAPAPLSLKRM
jgi:hypothetical protein